MLESTRSVHLPLCELFLQPIGSNPTKDLQHATKRVNSLQKRTPPTEIIHKEDSDEWRHALEGFQQNKSKNERAIRLRTCKIRHTSEFINEVTKTTPATAIKHKEDSDEWSDALQGYLKRKKQMRGKIRQPHLLLLAVSR